MRNYRELFRRLAGWLNDDGKCFIHVFCHTPMYPFEDENGGDWMARHFFTGGTMPALNYCRLMTKISTANRNGQNQASTGQTSLHWLENTDKHKEEIIALFARISAISKQRFNGAGGEFSSWPAKCFNFNNGNEWLVGHYRFSKITSQSDSSQAQSCLTCHSSQSLL